MPLFVYIPFKLNSQAGFVSLSKVFLYFSSRSPSWGLFCLCSETGREVIFRRVLCKDLKLQKHEHRPTVPAAGVCAGWRGQAPGPGVKKGNNKHCSCIFLRTTGKGSGCGVPGYRWLQTPSLSKWGGTTAQRLLKVQGDCVSLLYNTALWFSSLKCLRNRSLTSMGILSCPWNLFSCFCL